MLDTIRVPQAESLTPKIVVFGVGGGGCNAVSKMQKEGLNGVEFVVANTDAQSLEQSGIIRQVQLGVKKTNGLGAGANPQIGRDSAEEARAEISEQLEGCHMCFVTAGMGGGTGTGAAPIVAEIAREMDVLTVGVVTKPFHFEGSNRYEIATKGVDDLRKNVHTLVVLPNQNLFKVTNDSTPIGEIFQRANQVLYKGIKSITDLMVLPGLINLDFADVKAILSMEGAAIMGTGEAEGEKRAKVAAANAMDNQLLEDIRLSDAQGVLINVIGGNDMTLLDLQDATETIRENVVREAKIIVGSVLDPEFDGRIKVTLIATGLGSGDEMMEAPEVETEDIIEVASSDPVEEPIDDHFADPDPDNSFHPGAWPQDLETGRQVQQDVMPLAAQDEQGQTAYESGADDFQTGESEIEPQFDYVAPRLKAHAPVAVDDQHSNQAISDWSPREEPAAAGQQSGLSWKSMLGRMRNSEPPRPGSNSDPRLTAGHAGNHGAHEADPREIPAFIRRQAN